MAKIIYGLHQKYDYVLIKGLHCVCRIRDMKVSCLVLSVFEVVFDIPIRQYIRVQATAQPSLSRPNSEGQKGRLPTVMQLRGRESKMESEENSPAHSSAVSR